MDPGKIQDGWPSVARSRFLKEIQLLFACNEFLLRMRKVQMVGIHQNEWLLCNNYSDPFKFIDNTSIFTHLLFIHIRFCQCNNYWDILSSLLTIPVYLPISCFKHICFCQTDLPGKIFTTSSIVWCISCRYIIFSYWFAVGNARHDI